MVNPDLITLPKKQKKKVAGVDYRLDLIAECRPLRRSNLAK